MKTMHIGGPWHVEPAQFDEGKSIVICRANLGILATIHHDEDKEFSRATDKANAKLMAAAPAMLEALQAVQDEMNSSSIVNYIPQATIKLVSNAIAKAITKVR